MINAFAVDATTRTYLQFLSSFIHAEETQEEIWINCMFLCGCKCRSLRASTGRKRCFIRGAGLIRSCILLFFYSALLCSSPLCSPFSSSALLYQTFLYSCLLCSIILSYCLLLCSSLLYSSLPCPCLLYPSVFCFLYLDIFCSIPPSAFCSLLFFTPPSSTLLLVYSSLFCSSPLYFTPTLPFPTLFLSALLDLHHTDPTKFL